MRQTGNDNLIWYVSSKYGFEVRILSTRRSNMTNTVNDLINAHSKINAPYLIQNAPNPPPPPGYAVKFVLNAPLSHCPSGNTAKLFNNGGGSANFLFFWK